MRILGNDMAAKAAADLNEEVRRQTGYPGQFAVRDVMRYGSIQRRALAAYERAEARRIARQRVPDTGLRLQKNISASRRTNAKAARTGRNRERLGSMPSMDRKWLSLPIDGNPAGLYPEARR